MQEQFIRSVVALLAILNPLGAVPVFLGMMHGQSPANRLRAARTATIAVFLILVVSAALGHWVLAAFGLQLSALRAGGGLIVILMGLEMLRGQPTAVQHEPPNDTAADTIIVPFAMPTLAGPGAITTAITLTADRHDVRHAAMTGAAIAASSVVLFAVLAFSGRLQKLMSERGQRILLRFMGLLLVSLGAQFLLEGARAFWFEK